MCLYPRLIQNPKYKKNQKNGGVIPAVNDTRILHVPIGCQNCMECRKQKAREWKVRLMEDIKTNTNGQMITLTFSEESIKELNEQWITKKDKATGIIHKIQIKNLEGYERDNAIATKAIRLFVERWRKKYKKSIRHWMITELGHIGTERIHLHGIMWSDKPLEIKKIWGYGYVWDGYSKNGKRINYVNQKTVNYIVKYIHKIDQQHKAYKGVVLTSAGIGGKYTERIDSKKNKYKENETDETYRTDQGHKIALPNYWRNKIYTDEEKEKMWIEKIEKQERWVDGERIDISKGEKEYYRAVEEAQKKSIKLGYGTDKTNWKRWKYELERRKLIHKTQKELR